MPKLADLRGQKFRFLTVIDRIKSPSTGRWAWLCQCECGQTAECQTGHLRSGHAASCGCKHAELSGNASRKHGLEQTPEYKAWLSIKQRCYNTKNPGYALYGARGITVCAEWLFDPAKFYRDLGPRPSPQHSLDRINNNGPYSPENCRWATKAQQTRNRRITQTIVVDGERIAVSEAAERFGLNPGTLKSRLARGKTVADALCAPISKEL